MVQKFKEAAEKQTQHFTGNNIMMTMGSDFQYRNAYMWYKNLDKEWNLFTIENNDSLQNF
jgi:lysosomal alpha-mannosidase